jgi:hypothetical protein
MSKIMWGQSSTSRFMGLTLWEMRIFCGQTCGKSAWDPRCCTRLQQTRRQGAVSLKEIQEFSRWDLHIENHRRWAPPPTVRSWGNNHKFWIFFNGAQRDYLSDWKLIESQQETRDVLQSLSRQRGRCDQFFLGSAVVITLDFNFWHRWFF